MLVIVYSLYFGWPWNTFIGFSSSKVATSAAEFYRFVWSGWNKKSQIKFISRGLIKFGAGAALIQRGSFPRLSGERESDVIISNNDLVPLRGTGNSFLIWITCSPRSFFRPPDGIDSRAGTAIIGGSIRWKFQALFSKKSVASRFNR